jgi:hypothetical protein
MSNRIDGEFSGASLRCTGDNPLGLPDTSENMAVLLSIKPGEITYRSLDELPINRRYQLQYYYSTKLLIQITTSVVKIPYKIVIGIAKTVIKTHEEFNSEMDKINNEEIQQRLLREHSPNNSQMENLKNQKNPIIP